MVSAASVVIAHNHPSGPARRHALGADIQLTRRLVKAGDVLGIEVLDHLVLSGTSSRASEITGRCSPSPACCHRAGRHLLDGGPYFVVSAV